MNKALRQARRITIFIMGITVIAVGVALLVLPGPGLLIMLAGLVILSAEFEWADKHRRALQLRLRQAKQKARRRP